MCVCVLSHFSRVWLFVNLWTVTHQASLSMGISKQEFWKRLPCPSPGDLLDPGIKLVSHVSCIGKQILYHWSHLGSPWLKVINPFISLSLVGKDIFPVKILISWKSVRKLLILPWILTAFQKDGEICPRKSSGPKD